MWKFSFPRGYFVFPRIYSRLQGMYWFWFKFCYAKTLLRTGLCEPLYINLQNTIELVLSSLKVHVVCHHLCRKLCFKNLALLSILQRLFSGSLPLMKRCISILEEKKTPLFNIIPPPHHYGWSTLVLVLVLKKPYLLDLVVTVRGQIQIPK